MVRKKAGGEALQSARKRVIKEMQAAIARELAQSEVPKSMPQRIADLVRELHRRLREASQTRDTDSGPPETGGKGAR
jgi:hypothetical protein